MPWPRRFQFSSGSVQAGSDGAKRARRVNRHARQHINSVFQQALLLEKEERAVRVKHLQGDADNAATCLEPLRGVRYPGESSAAVSICNDYLLMPRRSLRKLYKSLLIDEYRGVSCKTPTLDTLKSWSRRYHWQARALLFDEEANLMVWTQLEQRRNAMERAEQELERRSRKTETE